MKIFRSLLVRKFAVYSLIASTVTGVGLSMIISSHIASDAIQEKIEMVQTILNNSVNIAQLESSSDVPSSKELEAQILKRISLSMESMDATDYYVWNQSGFLIHPLTVDVFYSTLKSHNTDGHKQSVEPVSYEIATTVAQPKEKWLKLKFMLPTNLGQTYTIETLFPYAQIETHQKALVQNIVITLTAGLFLQYLLLIRVIGRASNTLVHQKDSLNQKNQELQHTYEQLNISFHATVKALADSVDARDAYTAGHVGRVMQYAQSIGEALGLDEKSLTQLVLASQMHDIGKIGISDAVLLKPSQLNDSEYETIKSHPQIGVSILENIPDFKEILPAVLHHHERFDGLGYPHKLSGFDIPLNARIIAVADAYDAMTTNRPYRKSLDHSEALRELIKNRGTQFDPEIIDILIEILHTRTHSPQPIQLSS